MNVLVTGGDGFVGRHLCDALAARGHDVTALSRNPDASVFAEDVATVMGDVTAYDSIAAAFEDQDVVINLVALSPLFKPSGEKSHESVHLGGTENAVRAAEEHDVERFVQMSALGADPRAPTAYLRAKGEAEAVVRAADLDWVLVRPSVIFGDGGEFVSFTTTVTPPYLAPLPKGGQTKFQPIWVGDLAPMLADCAIADEHVGETHELGGPAVLTLADVARLAYRAEGKSVSILPVPMSLTKLGMGLAGPIPFVPFGPDQARSLDLDNVVEHNNIDAFGVEPTELRTLADYLGVA